MKVITDDIISDTMHRKSVETSDRREVEKEKNAASNTTPLNTINEKKDPQDEMNLKQHIIYIRGTNTLQSH